jgi:arylsulfatase A-like enzyme
VRLVFHPPVAVEAPVIRPVMHRGRVEVVGDTITQTPWSVVEIVRLVGPHARLVGALVPPEEAAENQRLEVVVDGGPPGGAKRAFRWRWNDVTSAVIEVDLPLPEGRVAIRLVARGRGGPATWRRLSIVENVDPIPATTQTPAPPRLAVLYVLDALRADHVGGRGWTPVLDRLAAEGVSFTDYQSAAPSTLPSTKTLFSGRFSLDSGGLPGDVETIAEVMAGAGFRTIGISGNGYVSDKFGMTRGFDHFEMVYPLARGADPATYVNRNAADVHRRALELLDDSADDRPTFLYLHTIHPHSPYAPPREMVREMCGGIPSNLDGMSSTLLAIRDGGTTLSDADRRRLRCLYAASLAYNDARIGELAAELERRYPGDEILFIVTSDHGEEFFDHGGLLHGHTLYDELLQVPLVFRWPGHVSPRTVDLPGDTFDLHETLRTLVGAGPSRVGAEGRSLWPAILGDDPTAVGWRPRHAAVPTLPGGMFMARSDGFKLVWAPRSGDGWGMGLGLGRGRDPEYFFDLAADPGETRNLVGGGTVEERWLRSRLRAWIDRYERETEVAATVLDEDTRRHLEALGYVE